MARGKRAVEESAEAIEGPWELPDGWRWERLGNAVPLAYGKALAGRDRDGGGTTPVYGSSGVVGRHTAALVNGPAIIVGRKGSAGAVHYSAGPCWPIDTAYFAQPRLDIDPRYTFHLLTHLNLGSLDQSTAIPSLGRDTYSDLVAPFPSVERQRVLARRIDDLFAEIDDGEAALAEARAGVETYRKALLKAAVTGELTADWRRENPPKETGQDLLRRILADRRAVWEADPKNRKKRYEEPAGPEEGDLHELPDGWCWGSLGQLLFDIEAGLNVKALGRPPSKNETGIVKISAVTWDEFDEDASKALLPKTSIDVSHLIRIGDFLISRANTLELVGAPVIVREISRRLVLSDKVLRLIVSEQIKEWLYYVLKSPQGRAQIESRSTGAQLSMRNISQSGLRALPIPIPPLDEVCHIVKSLRSGWQANEELKCSLVADMKAPALRQSILSAAFRGELVS